jgi:hypothetical protein
VLTIIGVLTGVVALPLHALAARLGVQGAVRSLQGTFAEARMQALTYGTATVELDAAAAVLRLRVQDSLWREQPLGERFGVTLQSNTAGMTFDHLGRGRGLGNGSIIVRRGGVADTLVVSRLGRVRE